MVGNFLSCQKTSDAAEYLKHIRTRMGEKAMQMFEGTAD